MRERAEATSVKGAQWLACVLCQWDARTMRWHGRFGNGAYRWRVDERHVERKEKHRSASCHAVGGVEAGQRTAAMNSIGDARYAHWCDRSAADYNRGEYISHRCGCSLEQRCSFKLEHSLVPTHPGACATGEHDAESVADHRTHLIVLPPEDGPHKAVRTLTMQAQLASVIAMRTDLEIARAAELRPITDVAEDMGIPPAYVEQRGTGMAKIHLGALDEMNEPRAKYVLVTAVNPTPFGEGKTTVSVGLAQGFKLLDERAVLTLRQPSLGPTFGIKGGAAGGGYSQVVPMEEMNLHLTGDFHAITAANNLLSALIDNHIYQGNQLSINVKRVTWRRVMDVNDRSLRNIVVGLGTTLDGIPREGGFDITAASELMAVLGLATGLKDLRERLGRIVIGYDRHKKPVTAEDVKGAGAMAVLLKDALNPNLMQTLEGTPALIHTGPFANIAHGNSSIVADQIGIRSGDYLITEAGFGSDVGAEKFFNLKCAASGMSPDVAVIVATVRALKLNSGKFSVKAGKPLPDEMVREHPDDVMAGADNLRRHIANVRQHGVTPVVAVNSFPTDHASEHAAIGAIAEEEHAIWAIADPHNGGAKGMVALAEAVRGAAKEGSNFVPLYRQDMSLTDKIETIATKVYGADGVEYDIKAKRQLADYEAHGYGNLPICMAKTQYSFSHNPALLGAPTGWTLPVREVQLVAGAGFVLPLTGSINRMPGLGLHPAAHSIDIDEDGNVVGLS